MSAKRTHNEVNDCRVPLRIPRGMRERVEAEAGPGNRSAWIRDAIDRKLAALAVMRKRAELDEAMRQIASGRPFFEDDENVVHHTLRTKKGEK